jgi:hypothetical protein
MRRFEEVSATVNIWLAVITICGAAIGWRLFAPLPSGIIDALLVLSCLAVVSLAAFSTATVWRRHEATTEPPEGRSGPV